jgi:murein L,D-transpeptidase YafK
LREFDVSLGQMPNGPKQREGDFRTPEGKYYLDERNVNSDYFLSIHVSYPNEADRARARAQGVDPGGQIMIHGLPNEPRYELRHYLDTDWTDGCIAVSNSDMVDIWLMTRESTPIEIRP